MNEREQFELCLARAREIVTARRAECPPGFDPQASVVYVAVMVVGAAVSAYSSYSAGKAQQMQADFNAAQQERNARLQLLAVQTQANLQRQQAEANFAINKSAAQSRFDNSKSLENQALSQDAINRVNLRKRGEEFAQFQSTQRANIAASGISESTGTPLDILAETAGKIQQDQEEQHYGNELQRRTLFSEAAAEKFGGKLALAGATLDRGSGVLQAGLQAAAGRSEYQGNMRAAELTRIGGAYARQAGNLNAAATLLSGIGQAAGGAAYRTS